MDEEVQYIQYQRKCAQLAKFLRPTAFVVHTLFSFDVFHTYNIQLNGNEHKPK